MAHLPGDLRHKRNARIEKYLLQQHGVISHAQACSAGASQNHIDYLVRTQQWRRLFRGVYRHAMHPATLHQQAIAACLVAGTRASAVVSGMSAGRLHLLDGMTRDQRPGPPSPIEVTSTRKTRVRGIVAHLDPFLSADDCTRFEGVPVTTVARTIVDLARRCHRALVERALDDALRRRLTDLGKIEQTAGRARGRGRRSMHMLDAVIAARRPEDGLAESRLEQRVLRALRAGGLPAPVPQYPVATRRHTVRLDLAYPVVKLGIEVDGFEFHKERRAFDVDRRRANDLLVAGWTLLRVTSAMSNDEMVELVGRALERMVAKRGKERWAICGQLSGAECG